MKKILEFVTPDVEEPLLVLHDPPILPNVGDLVPGPNETVYYIAQRAYVVEKPTGISLISGGKDTGAIIIQCVLLQAPELKSEEEGDQPDAN